MIYDTLQNATHYLGEQLYLNQAFQFISEHDLNTYPMGTTELVKDCLFFTIMEAKTKPKEQGQFEWHKKFYDIQIDLTEEEMLYIGEKSHVISFDEQHDFGLMTATHAVSCHLTPNHFVVCDPGEAHMPTMQVGTSKTIKKCVFKVLKQ